MNNQGKMNQKTLVIGAMLVTVSLGLGAVLIHRTIEDDDPAKLVYTLWLNSGRDLFKDSSDDIPAVPDDEGIDKGPSTRRPGGQIEWMQRLNEGAIYPLSTPALVDLNNDGDLEVVIASSSDLVYALGPDGGFFWDYPYSDDVIEDLTLPCIEQNLDFMAPPIFSSVIAADVNLGDTPEIIIGVKDGALCIGADGEKQWKKGMTTGYYFSTACITDLEGEWTGNKEDLEIVLASDDGSRRGWLEAFEVDGGAIFREEAPTGGEGGLIGCSVVACDLDGDFWDGPLLVTPDVNKERDTELIIGNHDRGFRVWERQGENADGKPNYDEAFSLQLMHQCYATTAVANVTGSPELESFVGLSEGWDTRWTGWWGVLACLDPDGKVIWKYSLNAKPSSIFSSPAVADLQMAKLNPNEEHLDYEIIFGADNGLLYVLDAQWHSPLWTFDTGGRVLSSPAICNIDNYGECEIIIGSDSKKVFCLDGDPSDGIDEGVPYPGDGKSHDVLWVYETEAPIGISSPVVADIDLDGMLEVVIGDSEGNVYCISAGGRSLVGQEDWPQFHCDLNRTGFFNPQISYGVDIYPKMDSDGIRETMVRSADIGTENVYKLTIENTGTGQTGLNRDKIFVGIDERSVPEGWSAWLDTPPDAGNEDPEYVRLASQETADLELHVFAPWEGRIGEMARINVTANSSRNMFARDSITALTVLDLHVDMDIQWLKDISSDPISPLYGKKWDHIPPGRENVYLFSIINKGNLNDTYDISLSAPPVDAGWSWYIVGYGSLEASADLSAQLLAERFGGVSGRTFTVKVTCPPGTAKGTTIPVQIRATSRESLDAEMEEITRRDDLYLVVGEQSDLYVKMDTDTRYVHPNGTVLFNAMISNTGNREMMEVLMTVDGTLPGWSINHVNDPIMVHIGQTVNVPIRVRAPPDARAGAALISRLTVYDLNAPDTRAGCSFTTIVMQVFDIDAVSRNGKDLCTDQGGTLDILLDIYNNGNGDDEIVFTPEEVPLGWNLTFLDGKGSPKRTFFMDKDSIITVRGRLLVPEPTRTGNYVIGIGITGRGSFDMVYARVFINQTFDIDLKTCHGQDEMTSVITPGVEKTFLYGLTNNGNGPDMISLRIGSAFDPVSCIMNALMDGWTGRIVAISNTPGYTSNIEMCDFGAPLALPDVSRAVYYVPDSGVHGNRYISGMELLLDMGQTAWVHVAVKAPVFWTQDTEGTTVMISASGLGSHDLMISEFHVLLPDLEFVDSIGISYHDDSKRPGPGDTITILVRVHNTGDISAENVDVQLLVDGVSRKISTINSLKNRGDDVKVLIFTWIAEPG
ncbi:MAG: hypothetical protein JW939_05050, partial [Candidatus Thermoplasmatota archaeon]|nr:hypothetical protein [Candidatus Thermoplasmatota archaeon]